jgi:DNA-binding LacI/PurR family transcriptional regulator
MAVQRVKLADVAAMSGVSLTSASMALADNPRVAESTRERVRAAAAQLGYVPHAAAAALRSQRPDAIAVVVPHDAQHVFSHPVFSQMLEGIITVANEQDISPILSTARSAEDESSAYSRILRSRLASGVIVAAASTVDQNVLRTVEAGHPLVLIGRDPEHPGLTTVGVDDFGGAFAAVDHLIARHGARRIAHVSGPLHHRSAQDKRDGYLAALRAAGLDLNLRLQVEGDYTELSGTRAAETLLPFLSDCDAIFFANDQMAVAAMEFLHAQGIDVPRDIRVVGYDDHPALQWYRPGLTTVHTDMVRVGAQAMRSLLALLDGSAPDRAAPTEYPTELVVRGTCGC